MTSIPCPLCLTDLEWESLEWFEPDPTTGYYIELDREVLGPTQLLAKEQNAYVRCTNTADSAHYLPLSYGKHGRPIVMGLVGKSASGKSHLLTAIVKALADPVALHSLGVSDCIPVHPVVHKEFWERQVRRLFDEGKALPGTSETVTTFADGFVLSVERAGVSSKSVVAIFDVAGSMLERVEAQQSFLFVVDGLVFAADPTSLRGGDSTFQTVTDLMKSINRKVATAVALTKADRIRFDQPVDYWLRRPVTADEDEAYEESRDAFAYLYSRGAKAWLRPFTQFQKATMHFVSATGGPSEVVDGEYTFVRGVTPRRELAPLASILRQLGVIGGAS